MHFNYFDQFNQNCKENNTRLPTKLTASTVAP